MINGATLIFTSGVPGAGKTFVRCACFLVDDFLINTDVGIHYSNFPVNREEVAKHVSQKLNFKRGFWSRIFGKKVTKVSYEDVLNRVQIIPKEELIKWRQGISGPWIYFSDKNLVGAHIAIDECHEYCNIRMAPEAKTKWSDWIGTIRHLGCTVEFISQNPKQVLEEIKSRAGLQLQLSPSESLRDPFFHVILSDWYELQASFIGEYRKGVHEHEFRPEPNAQKLTTTWKENHIRKFRITSDYFPFYNSYNQSLINEESGQVEAETPQHEFQKRTRTSLIYWFISRNFFRIFPRIVFMILLFSFLFCGGVTWSMTKFVTFSSSFMAPKKGKENVQTNKKTVLVASSPVSDPTSSFQGSSQVDLKDDQINKLRKRIVDLELEIIKLKELEKKGYTPVMFTSISVLLKNGLNVKRGYTFKGGIYDGLQVAEILVSDRCIILSNGVVLSFQL